jgi:hypothetical protein
MEWLGHDEITVGVSTVAEESLVHELVGDANQSQGTTLVRCGMVAMVKTYFQKLCSVTYLFDCRVK